METIIQPNRKATLTLSAGHFIIDNYSSFIMPILPLLAIKLNTTMAVITAILSIGHLCSSIAQPFFGYIADRWKRRFFLIFGLFFGAVFHSLIGIVPNLPCLAVCIALGSLGSGFYHPQATSMMVMFSHKDAAVKEMGIFLACGTLGYSLGPVISSTVTNFAGIEYLPITVITGILCMVCVFKFVPKISNIPAINEEKPKFFKAVKVILKDRTMRILLMIATFKSMVSMLLSTFPPFLWTKMGYSTMEIGIIIFLFLGISAFGTYSSPYFEAKFGTIRTFRISMLSSLPLVILYFSTCNIFPVASLIFYFAAGYCAMLSVSINMVMAQKHMPEYKSIIAGFIGGVSWGLVGICLGIFGKIGQHFGIPTLIIGLCTLPFIFSYTLKYLPKDETVQ